MKLILALLFVPSLALAAKIPLDTFEQSKLETLLRKIPSALVRTEEHADFIRKHYLFPKNKSSSFTINCHADYFGAATVPSFKVCDVELLNKDYAGDEQLVVIEDVATVNDLRSSISYGAEIKKYYSFERVYGQSHDGTYRNLFRFSFVCKTASCEVTLATKKPDP
ncbi:MAG: hypothetical protein H0V66_15980 [Bdellovibrionales bacterium]|nr:hypothetical protein [Bdellovibrionales bacterium]